RRILEYGPDLDRELALARLALPDAPRLQERMLGAAALRTDGAVRPADTRHVLGADIEVGEVPDCFEKRGGEPFLGHTGDFTTSPQVCQVYRPPCCGGPVQPGQNDTYSRATSGDSPQTWDNVTCLRRIRTWDANGRTRGGGGGRPRGCTAASSTGSCGPADPESCAGRRRLRADAWRRRAAADADERTRG